MKKIGLVCDNYKLQKFKEEFVINNIENIAKYSDYKKGLTLITFEISSDLFDDLKNKVEKIAKSVERHFYFNRVKNN